MQGAVQKNILHVFAIWVYAGVIFTGGFATNSKGSGEVKVWLQGAEWEDPDFGHPRSLQLTP